MTDDTMPLSDAQLKRGGATPRRARPMDFDVEGQIGASRFERSEAPTTGVGATR